MKPIIKLVYSVLVCIPVVVVAANYEQKSASTNDLSHAEMPAPQDKHQPTGDEGSSVREPAGLGKMLYENHCTSCHESNIHIRENHKAKSVSDLYYWVNRWSTTLTLSWSEEQKNAVVEHLRATFYKF